MKEYVGVLLELLVLVGAGDYKVAACALAGSEPNTLFCPAHFIPFGLDVVFSAAQNDSRYTSTMSLSASSLPEMSDFGSYRSSPASESSYHHADRPDEVSDNYLLLSLIHI